LACYGDDPTTAEDEGAVLGDVLTFRVDDAPVTAAPIRLNGANAATTTVTWTGFGDVWEVDPELASEHEPIGGYSLPATRLAAVGARATLLFLIGLLAALPLFALAVLGRRRRRDSLSDEREPGGSFSSRGGRLSGKG
jgi:hypothetical protein